LNSHREEVALAWAKILNPASAPGIIRPESIRTDDGNAIARLTGALMKSDDPRDKTDLFPRLNVADVPAGVEKVAAAPRPEAHDQPNQVVANAAESALQHHPGFMIASNEIAANRRVDFDTTVAAMALTAKEMNAKYKETSVGGLAVSLVLC
jgi:hypothetical protein